MGIAILVGLGFTAVGAAEIWLWFNGFGWTERLALWIVIVAAMLT